MYRITNTSGRIDRREARQLGLKKGREAEMLVVAGDLTFRLRGLLTLWQDGSLFLGDVRECKEIGYEMATVVPET